MDHVWVVLIAGAALLVTWWAVGTRSQEHHVRASFAAATLVVPGLDVRVDGLIVGKVSRLSYEDGRAIVALGLQSGRYWPLHQGTRAQVRFGTTIGNGTRYVELQPGPQSAPPIPEGGVIPERDSSSAVEFDEVLNTLGAATRGHVRRLLTDSDTALTGHTRALNSGLRAAPEAAGSAESLLGDLATDGKALDGLVVNTSRVSRTLAARTPAVADLVTVAARTFARFAENAGELKATLVQLPPTLSQTRSSLARLDTSIDGALVPLMDALRPGARELPGLGRAASRTLRSVRAVVPSARSTVAALHRAAPDLSELLARGTPLVEKVGAELGALAPMMACIRPYAPEAGGFFVGWGGWVKNYTLNSTHPDPNPQGRFSSHYARVQALAGPESVHDYPVGLPISKILALLPGVRYAFPMPPGFLAGNPQLNAACGYGPDSLNPAKDPENGTP